MGYDDTIQYLLNWIVEEKQFANTLDPVSAGIQAAEERTLI